MAGAVPYSHEDNDLAHVYCNLKFEGYAFRFEDTELTLKDARKELLKCTNVSLVISNMKMKKKL